jgi:hypothetical protein
LNLIERGYVSSKPVVELLQHIRELFVLVDEETPIQLDKLFQYKERRAEYERMARASCGNAKSKIEEWYDEKFVEQNVPEDFTVAVPEGAAVPPYLRSGRDNKVIPKDRQVRTKEGVIYDKDELRHLLSSDHPVCQVTGNDLAPADFPEVWD